MKEVSEKLAQAAYEALDDPGGTIFELDWRTQQKPPTIKCRGGKTIEFRVCDAGEIGKFWPNQIKYVIYAVHKPLGPAAVFALPGEVAKDTMRRLRDLGCAEQCRNGCVLK